MPTERSHNDKSYEFIIDVKNFPNFKFGVQWFKFSHIISNNINEHNPPKDGSFGGTRVQLLARLYLSPGRTPNY